MAFVLDTSIAIPLRDGDLSVINQISALEGPLMISVVTRVELEGGVYRFPDQAAARRQRLNDLLAGLDILAFDDRDAEIYREIVEAAGYSRRKLLDRMIAAHALAHRATLVTRNGDDFRDIPGLKLLEL